MARFTARVASLALGHACAGLLAATAHAQPVDAPPRVSARASIQTTSFGVPHVVGDDLVSVGFGAGYAQAGLAVCEMAGRFLTVTAERSRFLGPDVAVPDGPARVSNLQSDFFWARILDERIVENTLRRPAPIGPSKDDRDLARGFAAGYNTYLADVGVANLPDARCRGAAWVRPISERDVYLRAMHWNLFRSGGSMVAQLLAASPDGAPAPTTVAEIVTAAVARSEGSNMLALGAQATDNGRGMLFANPHWTWEGPDSWVEMHLKAPGRLNVIGMQTIGLPVIQSGFNEKVAWAGTSSYANRYTLYRLQLAPGSRTTYLHDGRPVKMTSRTVSVKARRADGQLETRTHRFWSTSFGLLIADKSMPWTDGSAFAMRDVGYTFRWLGEQLRINRATSARDLSDSAGAYMAIGWRNLSAADDQGNVFYGDRTAVPAVTSELARSCAVEAGEAGAAARGAEILVLDGARSACQWATFKGAPIPGIFSADELPQLHRRDYIAQSNDTHWLNNLREPLVDYPSIMGPDRTPRTLRTRNALSKVEGRLGGVDGYPGQRFTFDLLKTITMDNRVFSADIWLQDVIDMADGPGASPEFREAARVLRNWDRTENLDSHGAVLWRRFVERVAAGSGRSGPLDLYAVPFDVSDPIRTPRGLKTADPRVSRALAGAIADLRESGIPLDASLRRYQYLIKGDERIPVAGGPEVVGQYNKVDARRGWVPGEGYPDVSNGSSFLMWMQFTPQGPAGESIMTMSQSRNPASPYFADQSRLWAEKLTKKMLFTDADIASDRNLQTREICAGAACRAPSRPR